MTIRIFTVSPISETNYSLLVHIVAKYLESPEVKTKFERSGTPESHANLLANFVVSVVLHLASLTVKAGIAIELGHRPTADSLRSDIQYVRNMVCWIYDTIERVGLSTDELAVNNDPSRFYDKMDEMMADLDKAFPADALVA